jgi:hypothetical protein
VVRWFHDQDIGVEPRRPRFNPFYQHNVEYVYSYIYLVHLCKYIIVKWVVDR